MADYDTAESTVWERLDAAGVPTDEVSDTGTVENLVGAGLSLAAISDGRFTSAQLNAEISWL